MSNAAPPLRTASLVGQSSVGALTPERIERALADFRDWLTDFPAADAPGAGPAEAVDMHTLVGQFAALRHEVNLQTKAARATLEQNAAALRQLEEACAAPDEPAEEEEPAEVIDPATQSLVKALIDVYDSLALAGRQIEKQKTAIYAALATLLETMTIEPPPFVEPAVEQPGFWKRFFGGDPVAPPPNLLLPEWHARVTRQLKEREQQVRQTCDYLKDALDGVLTGYAMSLSRIDRVLTKFGLETMSCEGQRFDPEMMEVVEAVPNSGRPIGDVLEEVRRGYLWNDVVFRYAQVRVAR